MQEFGLNMVTLPFSYLTFSPTPRCLLLQTIQDCILKRNKCNHGYKQIQQTW
jgi:hypothetical protein